MMLFTLSATAIQSPPDKPMLDAQCAMPNDNFQWQMHCALPLSIAHWALGIGYMYMPPLTAST
jgi:hypothetical protein